MNTYTVKLGDNLFKIANINNVSLSDLLKANPQITNPNLIYSGQQINIPTTGTSTYTIQTGDTLWSIASKQGISLTDLLKANPSIINSNLIMPGKSLNIPSGSNQNNTSNGGNNNQNNNNQSNNDITTLEKEVARLVNVERKKAGVKELTENSEIDRIARLKSQDFINKNYFSHNSPTYGTPFEMLRSNGINFTAAAENIANGQGTAAEVMNSWMNSAGHKANILNSNYNQIGVGIARDSKGNLYWTQMFVKN